MAEYRFSGVFSSPPDRGSPNGNKTPFAENFEAESDNKARLWAKAYTATHKKIIHPRLEKIVVREQTEKVAL